MEPQTQALAAGEEPASEDLSLIAAVLRKDRKATAEFVARYADCVYSYVRRRVSPRPEAAEDLTQEVFLAAWQGLKYFRGEGTLRQWLLGIARHKVQAYYRERLRHAEWPDDADELIPEPAAVPLLDEDMDRTSRGEDVRRILALLPEAYSLALLWRYREDRSVREMAQMTGKTEKAIERLLARARDSFRKSWEHAGR